MLECTMYGGTAPVTRATHVRKLLYLLRADGSDVTPDIIQRPGVDIYKIFTNTFENAK